MADYSSMQRGTVELDIWYWTNVLLLKSAKKSAIFNTSKV